MNTTRRTFVGAGVLLAAVVMLSGCGLKALLNGGNAKQRVVVLEIERTKSPHFRSAINDALEQRYQVVHRSDYNRTARKLKAKAMTRKNIAKVSGELNLDAVVQGRVVRRGKRFVLRLRVREARSGKQVERIDIPVYRRRVGLDGREALETELMAAVAKVPKRNVGTPVQRRGASKQQVAAAPALRGKSKAKPAAKKPAKKADKDDLEFEIDEVDQPKPVKAVAKAPKKKATPKKAAPKKIAKAPKKVKKSEKRAVRPKKNSKKKPKAIAKVEDPPEDTPSMKVSYDESGQAVDDEVPDVLR
jgi:hypothetical protein